MDDGDMEDGETASCSREEQKRRRRARSIAIALALGALVAAVLRLTIVKLGPAVMNRPL